VLSANPSCRGVCQSSDYQLSPQCTLNLTDLYSYPRSRRSKATRLKIDLPQRLFEIYVKELQAGLSARFPDELKQLRTDSKMSLARKNDHVLDPCVCTERNSGQIGHHRSRSGIRCVAIPPLQKVAIEEIWMVQFWLRDAHSSRSRGARQRPYH
jgi:hypothetical protein